MMERKSKVSNQLQEEKIYFLPKCFTNITNNTSPIKKQSFYIAVTADWGCEKDTKKTVQNIQKKNPELVISGGDLSYHESSDCWFDIIKPLKSKMKIAMGDHEYSETNGGAIGIMNQYLKPLNLQKTYYSFDNEQWSRYRYRPLY